VSFDNFFGILICLVGISFGACIATEGMVKGKVRSRSGVIHRKQEPFLFWLTIATYYFASSACAAFFYYGWQEGDDLSASQFPWFSGDRPLFVLVLGLIGAVVYKLWGKKEDPSEESRESAHEARERSETSTPPGQSVVIALIGSLLVIAVFTAAYFMYIRH